MHTAGGQLYCQGVKANNSLESIRILEYTKVVNTTLGARTPVHRRWMKVMSLIPARLQSTRQGRPYRHRRKGRLDEEEGNAGKDVRRTFPDGLAQTLKRLDRWELYNTTLKTYRGSSSPRPSPPRLSALPSMQATRL